MKRRPGSSTCIEGSKLSDAEVEKLLSGLHTKSFGSRDEFGNWADKLIQIWPHEKMFVNWPPEGEFTNGGPDGIA